MMRRLGATAMLALACAAPAWAVEGQVVLPDPSVRLTPAPPLTGAAGPSLLVPRPGKTREVVLVGIDASGRPVRVAVDQQIELLGKGDYAFSVPGPVLDVRAPAGSRVEPGLLDRAIVWQGFSPGRRVLAAHARLDPREAAPVLPLAVDVRTLVDGRPLEPGERRSGQLEAVVTVRNRTAVRVETFTGTGSPAQLARALDLARRRLATGSRVAPALVTAVTSPTSRTVEAPFRVTGLLALPASATGVTVEGGRRDGAHARFAGTAGVLTMRVRARVTDATSPKLTLTAVPVREVPGLRPPRGGTWRAAVAAGRADGRELLSAAVGAMLRLARVNQYSAYLATPGAYEQARARYVYATAPVVATTAPAAPSDGNGTASALAAIAVALLGLGVAVVLWAHL